MLVILIVTLWLAARLEAPGEGAIRAYAKQASAAAGYEMQSARIVQVESGGGVATFHVEITARRSSAALYEALLGDRAGRAGLASGTPRFYAAAGTALPDWLALDLEVWARLRELATSDAAADLRQAAAFSAADLAVLQTSVVREVRQTPDAARYLQHRSMTVRAQRSGLTWTMLHEEAQFVQGEIRQPRTLGEFSSPVLVIDRSDDRTALQEFATRITELQRRVDRAAAGLFARKSAAFLASLRPGLLFAGTAEDTFNRTNRPRVYLEITVVRADENPARLSGLIRNDGGWAESRLFSGTVLADSAGDVQLKLSAPAVRDDREAGPLLSDIAAPFTLDHDEDGDAVLPLTVVGRELVWNRGGASLRLQPVSEAEHAEIARTLGTNHTPWLEATQSGRIYLGTVMSKAKGTKEEWMLVFTFQESITQKDPEFGDRPGLRFEARLENPARPKWKLLVGGDIVTNRYRSPDRVIHLNRLYDPEETPPEEAFDMFEERDSDGGQFSGIPLRLENGRLLGENARFVFRFEPASAEFVAAREKAAADLRARVQAFIAPGAIHEGVVERDGVTSPGALRLEFSAAETKSTATPRASNRRRDQTTAALVPVAATLSSARHPLFAAHFEGECDLERRTLLLRYRSAPDSPGGPVTNAPDLKAHFDNLPHYYLNITLALDAVGATGEGASSNARVALRFTSSDDATRTRLRAEESGRAARLRDFVQQGEIHDGKIDLADSTGAIRLRIANVEKDGKVMALLHSVSSLRHAVALEGKLAAHALRMEVKGFPADILSAAPDVPPVLEKAISYNSSIVCFVEGDAVVALISKQHNPTPVRLKFTDLSRERRAQLRREETEANARFRDFTAIGSIHEGEASRPGAPREGRVQLRVIKAGPDANGFAAELRSVDRPSHGVLLEGRLVPELRLLRLQTKGLGGYNTPEHFESLERDPDLAAIFDDFQEHDTILMLTDDTGTFRGSMELRFRQRAVAPLQLNFRASSPEQSTRLQKESVALANRLSAAFRAGVSIDGTTKRGEQSGGVQLRIQQVETTGPEAGRKFTAVLEPASLTEPSWKIEGRIDPERLRVNLKSIGPVETKDRPTFARSPRQAQLPALWASSFKLTLEKGALVGDLPIGDRSIEESKTRLEFPLK